MDNDKEERIALSIPEAARLSGLSVSYLYKLSAEGKLPVSKIGSRSLILVSAFKEWFVEHMRDGRKRGKHSK